MILLRTRFFTKMSHYTNSDGMLGIIKDGFRNVKNQSGGVSFFKTSEDALRNDSRYNVREVFSNLLKRNERIKRKIEKYLPEDLKKDIRRETSWTTDPDTKEYITQQIITEYISDNIDKIPITSTELYGTSLLNQKYLPYRHGNIFTDGRRMVEDYAGRRIVVPAEKTEKELLKENPKLFDREIGNVTFFGNDDKVTFPAGYKQASQIHGIGRGLKPISSPVYRMTVDTKNPVILVGESYKKGLGYRVEPEEIVQDTRKIEIPRGFFEGKLKRSYLVDYGKVDNPNYYNLEDDSTKKAVEEIKEKASKIFRSRGKSKN